MPLLGAIGRAIGSVIGAAIRNRNKSSGGSSGSISGGSSGSFGGSSGRTSQALTNFGAMRISAAQQKGLSELVYSANRGYALDEFSATAPYCLETVTQAKNSARTDAGLYGQTPGYSSDPYYSQPGSPGSDMVSVQGYVGNRGNAQRNKDDQTVIITNPEPRAKRH